MRRSSTFAKYFLATLVFALSSFQTLAQAYSCSIASPAQGASYAAIASVTARFSVVINSGLPSVGVQVTLNGVNRGLIFPPAQPGQPYEMQFGGLTQGSYTISATASRGFGSEVVSCGSVTFTVVQAGTNQPPTVEFISPTEGAAFPAGATVNFTVRTTDPDGIPSRVELYNGAAMLGSSTSAANVFGAYIFQFALNNPPSGAYVVTAKVFDSGGASTVSAPRNFLVGAVVPPPNQLPAVNLVAPIAGATFNTPTNITLSASASDPDGTVSFVEFYQGAVLLGSDSSAPYSLVWHQVPAGNYQLRAKAYDNAGGVATSGIVAVTVQEPPIPPPAPPANVLPQISLRSPSVNDLFEEPADILIEADAVDSDGAITTVEFYAGSTLLGQDTLSPYQFTWRNASVGSHSLSAVAVDNHGARKTSANVAIQVRAAPLPTTPTPTPTPSAPPDPARNNQPPLVQWSSPAPEKSTTGDVITLSVAASDPDGTITKIEILSDSKVLVELSEGIAVYEWDPQFAGTYQFIARAYDDSGAYTESTPLVIKVSDLKVKVYATITRIDPPKKSSLGLLRRIELQKISLVGRRASTVQRPKKLVVYGCASRCARRVRTIFFGNNSFTKGTRVAATYKVNDRMYLEALTQTSK